MIGINIPKYFSQFDGDSRGYTGACVETCLKMVDKYLTGREISIADIVDNGDGLGSVTSPAGAQQAAQWLGFDLYTYYYANEWMLATWLEEGRLPVVLINYGNWPNKYKQPGETFRGGHAILVTGISDDRKAVRFADPIFRGQYRNDGWMDNNKWADWYDLFYAWDMSYYGGKRIALVNVKTK